MNKQLIQSLYQIECIQFGEFVFKSGKKSNIYVNLRKIISYPALLRQLATKIWEVSQKQNLDLVCGVPYTAMPLATCFSLDHQIPLIMRRKEKKAYGTKQMIEGVFKPQARCLIIEDVITTGGSVLETAEDLEAVQLIVAQVICIVDRGQGGKTNLEKHYPLTSLLTLREILTTLLTDDLLTKDSEKMIVEKYLQSDELS